MQEKSIAVIGGGNMAQAIVFGLLKCGYTAEKITVCDPSSEKLALFAGKGTHTNTDNAVAAQNANVVLLAVKPQVLAEVCGGLAGINFSDKLIISIAAGISTARIAALLPSAQSIVRVMPNTPALVSAGMAGLFADSRVSAENKAFAESLLAAMGKTCWVEHEADMHAVTAGSGSSPAYFFLFMEAMQKALLDMGLSAENARLLIQQSALGAAKMVERNPQLALSTLRENVTSKGGTTAAALAVFNRYELERIVSEAMRACVVRSQEMETLF